MKHLSISIRGFEFDAKPILDFAQCIVNETDRIGVVGSNGAGKTTCMKLITGEIESPAVQILNTGSMKMGYLSQIHFDDTTVTVKEDLRNAFTEILSLEKELESAESRMEEDGGIERYTELVERFTIIG